MLTTWRTGWRATTSHQGDCIRSAFVKFLFDRLKAGEELYLMTGDLGFGAFDELRKQFPKNLINMGVAEQSLISIGTGMAMSGKRVYCYSILPFVSFRPFEQIRIACYNKAPIVVVGMGAGLDYGVAGSTHFGLEDIQVMTALPNIIVLSPCDSKETEVLLSKLDSDGHKKPVYLRLTKNSEPQIHDKYDEIKIGVPLKLRDGSDIAIVSTGAVTKTAIEVAQRLEKDGHSCEVWDMHTLKPVRADRLLESIGSKKAVVTIEENTGGLMRIIASEMKKRTYINDIKLISFALPDEFDDNVGEREWMLDRAGLSTDKIYSKLSTMIKRG